MKATAKKPIVRGRFKSAPVELKLYRWLKERKRIVSERQAEVFFSRKDARGHRPIMGLPDPGSPRGRMASGPLNVLGVLASLSIGFGPHKYHELGQAWLAKRANLLDGRGDGRSVRRILPKLTVCLDCRKAPGAHDEDTGACPEGDGWHATNKLRAYVDELAPPRLVESDQAKRGRRVLRARHCYRLSSAGRELLGLNKEKPAPAMGEKPKAEPPVNGSVTVHELRLGAELPAPPAPTSSPARPDDEWREKHADKLHWVVVERHPKRRGRGGKLIDVAFKLGDAERRAAKLRREGKHAIVIFRPPAKEDPRRRAEEPRAKPGARTGPVGFGAAAALAEGVAGDSRHAPCITPDILSGDRQGDLSLSTYLSPDEKHRPPGLEVPPALEATAPVAGRSGLAGLAGQLGGDQARAGLVAGHSAPRAAPAALTPPTDRSAGQAAWSAPTGALDQSGFETPPAEARADAGSSCGAAPSSAGGESERPGPPGPLDAQEPAASAHRATAEASAAGDGDGGPLAPPGERATLDELRAARQALFGRDGGS